MVANSVSGSLTPSIAVRLNKPGSARLRPAMKVCSSGLVVVVVVGGTVVVVVLVLVGVGAVVVVGVGAVVVVDGASVVMASSAVSAQPAASRPSTSITATAAFLMPPERQSATPTRTRTVMRQTHRAPAHRRHRRRPAAIRPVVGDHAKGPRNEVLRKLVKTTIDYTNVVQTSAAGPHRGGRDLC